MRAKVSIVGICFLLISAFMWGEDSLEKTVAKATAANPGDCAKVCFEAATKLVEASNKQYEASNAEQGLKLMADAMAFARKGTEASVATHKHQKHAEISLRKMGKRIHDIGDSLALDDRAPIYADAKEIEHLRDEMLTAMFGTPKKTLENDK